MTPMLKLTRAASRQRPMADPGEVYPAWDRAMGLGFQITTQALDDALYPEFVPQQAATLGTAEDAAVARMEAATARMEAAIATLRGWQAQDIIRAVRNAVWHEHRRWALIIGPALLCLLVSAFYIGRLTAG